jgi:hypothetical protein
VTAQAIIHAASATLQKVSVKRLEAVKNRNRHQKVAPRKTDEPLDFTLVIASARPTETILEQLVRLKLCKDPRSLPFAVPHDAHNGNLGVVITLELAQRQI